MTLAEEPIVRLILDGTAVRVRLDRIHRADQRPEVFVRCLRLLNATQQGNSRNSNCFPRNLREIAASNVP